MRDLQLVYNCSHIGYNIFLPGTVIVIDDNECFIWVSLCTHFIGGSDHYLSSESFLIFINLIISNHDFYHLTYVSQVKGKCLNNGDIVFRSYESKNIRSVGQFSIITHQIVLIFAI